MSPQLSTVPVRVGPGTRRGAALASPFVIILAGHLVARLADALWGDAAWITVAIVYWGGMAMVVALTTTREQRRGWFAPSRPRPWWVVPTALLLGIGPAAGILLLNLDVVAAHAALIVPWLVFAALNPLFEETYWRGTLHDATAAWPAWVAALATTALFIASHPLMWGVFSIGNRSPALYASLAVMGLVWFAMRRVTGSLRWPVLSHVLVDLGNLSVFVFVNAYVPPGH